LLTRNANRLMPGQQPAANWMLKAGPSSCNSVSPGHTLNELLQVVDVCKADVQSAQRLVTGDAPLLLTLLLLYSAWLSVVPSAVAAHARYPLLLCLLLSRGWHWPAETTAARGLTISPTIMWHTVLQLKCNGGCRWHADACGVACRAHTAVIIFTFCVIITDATPFQGIAAAEAMMSLLLVLLMQHNVTDAC